MYNLKMTDVPLLPGFKFENIQDKNLHLNQQFVVKNGYCMPKLNITSINNADRLQTKDIVPEFLKFGLYSYDKPKKFSSQFKPHFVIFDRKCLSFQGYFKHLIPEYEFEKFVYRRVNILYYLEDDSLTIIEPPIANAGYTQGRLVRRGRIRKFNSEQIWHWKDFNVGIDIEIYGIIYHICSCDQFTREFLLSQGIEVNENETLPTRTLEKEIMNQRYKDFCAVQQINPPQNKLSKFLHFDKKVLRFFAVLNDNDENISNKFIEHYKIHYYLIDDTVEVIQLKNRFEKVQPFSRLLSRTKLPKNYCVQAADLYSDLTLSPTETTQEYYEAKDFLIGNKILILGRSFYLYDCDAFTRTYFKDYLQIEQPVAIQITEKISESIPQEIPPHTGIGQPEDTIQSCLSIIPKPPKKDVIYFIENTNKFLRYSANLVTNIDNDKDRKFVIQICLADNKISIYEIKIPNSGFSSGIFLKPTLIPKKQLTVEKTPSYYSPMDFTIGTIVEIFGKKFRINEVDLAVYKYMERNRGKFSEKAINDVKKYLQEKGIFIHYEVENSESQHSE